MRINAIITGATGMVGEGVMHECLHHPDVDSVLIINRKPSGFSHPKLREIIHQDFFNLKPIEEQLKGFNACYFCLGVSSVGMKEDAYHRMSYDLTIHFAETVVKQNADMVFCYVSGSRTDSSEKGKTMWARVKGKTENKLLSMSFRKAYMFRPGYMHPTKGLKNTLGAYKYTGWLYPVLRAAFPKFVTTLRELGLAMINVTLKGYETPIIEVKDILALSKK